jgi:hypothetical protein
VPPSILCGGRVRRRRHFSGHGLEELLGTSGDDRIEPALGEQHEPDDGGERIKMGRTEHEPHPFPATGVLGSRPWMTHILETNLWLGGC